MSKGYGISFIDIDETLFRTFAKIHVVHNGIVIKRITNQEFNNYSLAKGEHFDFKEFKDGKLFNKTSIPIEETIKLVKYLLSEIEQKQSQSKIILLTARQNFIDKNNFLDTFRELGINVDNKEAIYIERTGNMPPEAIENKKKKVILKYLETGIYDKCQIIDDFKPNVHILKELAEDFPKEILEKIIKTNNIEFGETIIKFRGYLVNEEGMMNEVFSQEIKK